MNQELLEELFESEKVQEALLNLVVVVYKEAIEPLRDNFGDLFCRKPEIDGCPFRKKETAPCITKEGEGCPGVIEALGM